MLSPTAGPYSGFPLYIVSFNLEVILNKTNIKCDYGNFLYFLQVGLACCQIAIAQGSHVIGTAGSEKGINLVKDNGAHWVFNHREPGYMDKVQVSNVENC